MQENNKIEKKSIKFIENKPVNKIDWKELAKDCISFSNSRGGTIFIGIEDDASLPPENQIITDRSNKRDYGECLSASFVFNTWRYSHKNLY